MVQLRKPKPREGKGFAQSHTERNVAKEESSSSLTPVLVLAILLARQESRVGLSVSHTF